MIVDTWYTMRVERLFEGAMRDRPFQCHHCGTLYLGSHCPKCYPKKGRRRAGSGRRYSGHTRTTPAQVLGRDALPVNTDAVSSPETGDQVPGQWPTDRACTTEPTIQVQEWDEEAAGSSDSPQFLTVEVGMQDNKNVTTDSEHLAAIVEDLRRGLDFIRAAQGYGEVAVHIQVRPNGIADWDVAPRFTRKPHRE